MRKFICILGVCFFMCSCLIKAQNYDFKDASVELDKILREKGLDGSPGGSISIIYKGNELFNQSYGVEELGKSKIDDNSRFYIASVSKTFTSAAILKLYEEGKINLDNPASTYLSGIDCLKQVSIRQLLTHTSGIPDYYDFMDTDNIVLSNMDILQFASNIKLNFDPGTDYAYSNTAYVILATIIESITDKSFADYINNTFFVPLGMDNSFIKDSKDGVNATKVKGYDSDNKISDYNHLTYGAGGIYSTIQDLRKWYQAIRENKFLRKETWKMAFTPPNIPNKRTYLAMGWNYEDCAPVFPELHSVASFGILNGFRSYLFMVPELDFAIIMLSNSGEMIIDPYKILDIYFFEI